MILAERTLGHEVAEVAERLGKPLYPWQRHVVDVAMELDDDGQFIYRDLVLTVMDDFAIRVTYLCLPNEGDR